MSTVLVDYNPNDFFYQKINEISPNDVPNNNDCSQTYIIISDESCKFSTDSKSTWVKDASMNCYKREICKNKLNANEIHKLENNHLGSDQNYINTKAIYMNEYVKSFNLTIGILAFIFVLYKFKQ
jgi:hypothetical protein